METFIELKTQDAADPFGDTLETLEKPSGDARDTRGQVTTYLNAMQAMQHRTHSFGVLIVRDQCRLLRHTRSGIEATTKFDYSTTSYLQTFFWHLSHASPATRGIDETFQLVKNAPSEIRDLLKIDESQSVWKVCVDNHNFYVAEPFTRTHQFPVGRGTRCFIAVDCETKKMCVLKDVWRVNGYHPEGDVYARLHEHHVRNIPTILASGDVFNLDGGVGAHSCGTFRAKCILKGDAIRQHTHYRIVLNVVGDALINFQSTRELTRCVLDAIEGQLLPLTFDYSLLM